MARIIAALANALRPTEYREPPVHFHAGSPGRPEVCHDTACARPRLQLD